ncbi:histone-lysine N-methyltransferase SETMAR [Elysia marginata]|uniref:Histone-lysine N-methyltransferase SETMAR n=1 Tax=Elysia marginata TaxID=1093978 RepID=A0AAV4HDQ3_9GAST|nr:histone-lysine N-methyltransferase SETMAR [Elysia marginata]
MFEQFNTPSSKLKLIRVRRDKFQVSVSVSSLFNPTTRQCAPTHQPPNSGRLRQQELPTLPHPTYSPDLALSDYYLFPQLKKYLRGHHCDNDEEVIADVHRWCRGQSSGFFANGVRQLVKSLRLVC